MISKNKQKLIRSLALKKNRDELNLFIGEGTKVVLELLKYFHCSFLAGTPDFFEQNKSIRADEMIEITEHELAQSSLQKSPQQVIALFKKPQATSQLQASALCNELCLALDSVQDPGNLGTIIRLADWYGIKHIICSPDTADAFAPKVVQATMGSIGRVQLHFVDLDIFLSEKDLQMPIYGTFLEGENIYDCDLSKNGIIVMGNEGKGISKEIGRRITNKLFIPPYNNATNNDRPESLNVAIATAITCSEFRRQAVRQNNNK